MAFKLGNREKIVTGSIATIIAIALLHMFIFSPKAAEYERVKKEWEASVSKVEGLKGNIAQSTIEAYRKETQKYEEEIFTLVRNLNVDLPAHYAQLTPEATEKKRQDFIDKVNELLSIREQSQVKLTFMGPKGWDIPRQLPDMVLKKTINLWDIIAALDGLNNIIKVIQDPQFQQQKAEEYNKILAQLELNAADFPRIQKFGPIVPVIKLFVHSQLVWEQRTPAYTITKEKLYDLFRVSFPDDELFHYNKQLDALIDVIKVAERNKIAEISNVTLIERKLTTKRRQEEETQATPAPGVQPGQPMGPHYEELMMTGRLPPGLAAEYEMLGLPTGFMLGTPTPRPEEIIGALMPIQIRYKASNLNSSQFLYDLAYSPRTYVIDDIAIKTAEEGGVESIVTINVTAQIAAITMDLSSGEKEAKESVPKTKETE